MSLSESMRAIQSVREIPLREAVLLFPVAVLLHVLEEWPGFPRWARRFASSRYSDREHLVIHAGAIVFAVGAVALVRTFQSSLAVFGFFAIAFFPAVFCNAVFHVGASLLTRTYCPGVVTSVLVYLPLSVFLIVVALQQCALTLPFVLAALAFAATVHILEVGHNVFKRW